MPDKQQRKSGIEEKMVEGQGPAKVLALVGSPRQKGNTAALVAEAAAGVREAGLDVETVFLRELEFEGCRGCEGCAGDNFCILNDDLQPLFQKIFQARGLLIGSPTYWYNVSADIKAFIDRCYSLLKFHEPRTSWESLLGSGRKAVVIGVCEQPDSSCMGWTMEAMEHPLQDLGYEIAARVEAVGFFEAGAVKKDENILQEAREAGRRLAASLLD